MTSDVGPMIQQWSTGSALSHLRSFVAGVHVELDQVIRYLVTVDSAPERALARRSRMAALQALGTVAAAPDTVTATAGSEESAAVTGENGEEETFLTPRAGSPDSPALMEVDQQIEVTYPGTRNREKR
jgi:hypothetical protein